jgi:hypothetical protein
MNYERKLSSSWAPCLAAALVLSGCVIEEADVPADPTVSFPNWSTEHTQSQQVRVTAPAGWEIDRVEYSVDGGKWVQAREGDAGVYRVELSNLDIGDSVFALRVESSYLGESQTDLFYDTIEGIAPVFACDTPDESVLPTPDMIQDNGNEVRTMLGYFGDPDGGHTVTFMIEFDDRWGEHYQIVGSIINYGNDSITVEYDVGHASCDASNGDCWVSYGLTVWVDGELLCENGGFGSVINYDRNVFP